VEKAEEAVLAGIDAADWAKIRQVVVEVHDIDGRLAQVRARLEALGFVVAVEQDAWLAETAIVCLYARRPDDVLPPVPPARPSTLVDPEAATGTPLTPALATELRAFLAGRLPPHMVPDLYVGVPALPLGAHGKLDRKALPIPASGAAAPPAPARAPSTELERDLAALWRAVLGPVEIGLDDDFFRLGGHSLLAARLVGSVRERFGAAPGIKDFLDRPTLAAMAEAIEASRTAAKQAAADPSREIRRVDRGRRRLDRAALGLNAPDATEADSSKRDAEIEGGVAE
jgi:acyl carrier protein